MGTQQLCDQAQFLWQAQGPENLATRANLGRKTRSASSKFETQQLGVFFEAGAVDRHTLPPQKPQ
jgi:hypothetical protein